MKAFRLTQQRYSHQLSGKGASLNGARWNSKGYEMIYCAEHRSLALAEVLVHISLENLSSSYVMMVINIPDKVSSLIMSIDELPEGWNRFPSPESTKRIGDRFIEERKACILKIPSVVVKEEFNILINPNHPDFVFINIDQIEGFRIDERLFKQA